MARRGAFLVLEGPDKAGKSTQALLLVKALRHLKHDVLHTREPGGTPLAEEIRKILLKPGRKVTPITELLLYEAARAQHVFEKIEPALEKGKVVLCERFTLATLAYQGAGRGIDGKTILSVDGIATAGVRPDLTIVLDIPEDYFETRMAGKKRDRIEREGADFQRSIRQGYRRSYIATMMGNTDRIEWVSGNRPVEEVHADILGRVVRALHPASSRKREEGKR